MSTISPTEPGAPLKTWRHLTGARRRPSEYEVVSVGLLANHGWYRSPAASALELHPNLPINQWYRQNRDTGLQHPDWDGFRDPDALTYRSYTTLQHAQEVYVEGLLDEFSTLEHDRTLAAEWVDIIGKLYTPSRFLFHAQQMASAYLGMLSPASTMANCFAFQMGDAMRVVSRIAYRTVELEQTWPDSHVAAGARQHWETHPAWQGLRELMERVLVAYQWSEGVVALNLIAKPVADELALRQLSISARRNGDDLLGLLNDACLRDSERSRRWTTTLIEHIIAGADVNQTIVMEHVEAWLPLAHKAIDAYCEYLPDNDQARETTLTNLRRFHESVLGPSEPD